MSKLKAAGRALIVRALEQCPGEGLEGVIEHIEGGGDVLLTGAVVDYPDYAKHDVDDPYANAVW